MSCSIIVTAGKISIHAPRAGSDAEASRLIDLLEISIHAPRAGSDAQRRRLFFRLGISIHAPRAGSDVLFTVIFVTYPSISIHAPRAGSDGMIGKVNVGGGDFNPRSPCGERPPWIHRQQQQYDFNPRSPCGERPGRSRVAVKLRRFQSTLPVRGATAELYGSPDADVFQSTLPVRGATRLEHHPGASENDFNPRSPCGERLLIHIVFGFGADDFNPRSPCGERLPLTYLLKYPPMISIHAPRAGSD